MKQIISRNAFKRVRFRLEARTWIEIALGLLTFLAIILFYRALLSPQISFTNDRLELTNLRESWGQAAIGFGLRKELNPRADFFKQYREFRQNESIKALTKIDARFANLMSKANQAFYLLETGELRSERNTLQSAEDFDAVLYQMVLQVDEYAKMQLRAFQRSFVVTGVGVLLAIIGLIFLEVRLRASSAGEARNRALSRALIAAQEGERLRISHELHDAVAQDLAAAKLYCGLCEGADAKQAGVLLERAIEEVRHLCYGLRPAELDRLGIAKAATRLCAEAGKEMGIEVKLTIEGLAGLSVAPETEINIYRILQEALSNVRRHADASHVRVVLFGFGDYLELTVDDDGRGPRGIPPGLGRTGMEERTRMIGGKFRFGYGPWGGSSLRVTVPVRRAEAPVENSESVRRGVKPHKEMP
jgi:signal transduction histidine kinase